MKHKLIVFVRLGATVFLLVMVYLETGPWTCGVLVLTAFACELLAFNGKKMEQGLRRSLGLHDMQQGMNQNFASLIDTMAKELRLVKKRGQEKKKNRR